MNSGEFLVIGFNAKAVKTGLNIKNESFVSYEYQDIDEETIYKTVTSRPVYTSIVDGVTSRLIFLLSSIGKEESSVANIIISETNKLKTIIDESENPQIILDVNDSIIKMLKSLIIFETTSKNKLNYILNKIYKN